MNTTADGLRLLHDLRRSRWSHHSNSAHAPPPPDQPRLSEPSHNLIINREPRPPFHRIPDVTGERGRRLTFVELFSHDWGWHATDTGKIVRTSFVRY